MPIGALLLSWALEVVGGGSCPSPSEVTQALREIDPALKGGQLVAKQ
jgi:hypothetical protein